MRPDINTNRSGTCFAWSSFLTKAFTVISWLKGLTYEPATTEKIARNSTKSISLASPARAKTRNFVVGFANFRFSTYELQPKFRCWICEFSFHYVRTPTEISLLDLRSFVSLRTNPNRNFVAGFANFRFITYEPATTEKIARNSTKSISLASPARAKTRNFVVGFANFRFSTYELQPKFRCWICEFSFHYVRTPTEISLLDLRIFVSLRTNPNRNFVAGFANFRPAFEFSCGSAKFLRNFGRKITPFPPKFRRNFERTITEIRRNSFAFFLHSTV